MHEIFEHGIDRHHARRIQRALIERDQSAVARDAQTAVIRTAGYRPRLIVTCGQIVNAPGRRIGDDTLIEEVGRVVPDDIALAEGAQGEWNAEEVERSVVQEPVVDVLEHVEDETFVVGVWAID